MRTLKSVLVVALLTAPVATHAQAQPVAPRRFDKPLWTSTDGFSVAPDIRELKDGRVLVLDAKDKEVVLLSPTGQRLRVVGRSGAGPGEYRWPIRILPLPNDSTLVVDRELRRLLVIGPDALPAGVVSAPQGIGPVDYTVIADSKGAVVFPAAWAGTDVDPFVPLLRWDRGSGRVDTIGKMQMRAIVTVGDPNRSVQMHAIYFSPSDEILPAADGGVLLLRGKDYHGDLIRRDGTTQSFRPVAYTPIPLSAAEKKSEASDGDLKLPVPSHKPAFDAAVISPDGETWVRRTGREGATQIDYDILDAKGAQIGSVVLPKGRRIVAVTASRVYIARVDDDGLNWLEAHVRR